MTRWRCTPLVLLLAAVAAPLRFAAGQAKDYTSMCTQSAPVGGSCTLVDRLSGNDIFACCLRRPRGRSTGLTEMNMYGISSRLILAAEPVNPTGPGERRINKKNGFGFRLTLASTDPGAVIGAILYVAEGADMVVRYTCGNNGRRVQTCRLLYESKVPDALLPQRPLPADARIMWSSGALPLVNSPPRGKPPRGQLLVQVFRTDPSGPNQGRFRYDVTDPAVTMLQAQLEGTSLMSARQLQLQILSTNAVVGLSDEHGLDWAGFLREGPRQFSMYSIQNAWVAVYCGGCGPGELTVDGASLVASRLPRAGPPRRRFWDRTEQLGAPLDPEASIGGVFVYRRAPGAPLVVLDKAHKDPVGGSYSQRRFYRYQRSGDRLAVTTWGDEFGVESSQDAADMHCLSQVDVDLDGTADLLACIGGGSGRGPISIRTSNMVFTSSRCPNKALCGGPQKAVEFNLGHFGAREYGATLVARPRSQLLDVYLRSKGRKGAPEVPSALMRRASPNRGTLPYTDAIDTTPLPKFSTLLGLSVDLNGDENAELIVAAKMGTLTPREGRRGLFIIDPANDYRTLLFVPNVEPIGAVAMDLNGDEWLDLLVLTGIDKREKWVPEASTLVYLRNPVRTGDGTWDWSSRVDVAPLIEGSSKGIMCDMRDIGKGDLNNDGLEDVFIACSPYSFNSHIVLLNRGPDPDTRLPRFEVEEFAAGLRKDFDGGDALTLVDYNEDGRLDVVMTHGKNAVGPVTWFENDFAPPSSSWLALDLSPTDSNEQALGATITVRSQPSGRRQVRSVEDSSGTRGIEDNLGRRLHFGLGDDLYVDRVRVRWPSGRKQTLRNLRWRDALYILNEADAFPASI